VIRPEREDVTEFLGSSIGLMSGGAAVSVHELLEARELLEVPAARMAAERRTDAHLEALRESLVTDPALYGVAELFVRNQAFHDAIFAASQNVLIQIMTEPITKVLRTRFLRDQAPEGFWDDVAKGHQVLLDTIEAGDPQAAAAAMTKHLKNLRPTYERIDRDMKRNKGNK